MQLYRKHIVVLLVISATFFFLDKTSFFAHIGTGMQKGLVRPIVYTSQSITRGGSSVFESIFLLDSFLQKYTRVEEQRNFYRGEFLRLRAVEEENNFLRRALQIEQGGEESLLLARIIATDRLRPRHRITLDRGSRDGVMVGQAVIVAGRIFVGQIDAVDKRTSTVRLVTSEESSVSATLEHIEENVLIRGLPSGALSLELVPRETPLGVGEIILTSGVGSSIPPHLLIGAVRKVINEDTASFQQAIVEPFFGADITRQVFIVRN